MKPGPELYSSAPEALQSKSGKLAIECSTVGSVRPIEMKGSAFENGMPIPKKYTTDGENMSPPLAWDAQSASKELVLICEGPDTPTGQAYVHWIVYGISPEITSIAEGVKPISGAKKGLNSAGNLDYTGPMPSPRHEIHNYYFQLFALDAELSVKDAPNRDELIKAMQGHVIAAGKIVGTYECHGV